MFIGATISNILTQALSRPGVPVILTLPGFYWVESPGRVIGGYGVLRLSHAVVRHQIYSIRATVPRAVLASWASDLLRWEECDVTVYLLARDSEGLGQCWPVKVEAQPHEILLIPIQQGGAVG